MRTTYIASAFLISIFIVSCYTSDASLEQDSPKVLTELSPRHLPMEERHARAVNHSAADESSPHVPVLFLPPEDSSFHMPLVNDTNLYEFFSSLNSTDAPDLASGLDPGTTSTRAYQVLDSLVEIFEVGDRHEAPGGVSTKTPGGVPSVPSASSARPYQTLDEIIRILQAQAQASTEAPHKVPGGAPVEVPSVPSAISARPHQDLADVIKPLQVQGSTGAHRVAPGGVLLGASGRASSKAPGGAPTKVPGRAPEKKISDKNKFSKKNKFGKKNKYWKRLVFGKKKMST